jgi:putative nucleotidyltransferase with HDIG domain
MWFKKRASPRRQAIREDVAEAESQQQPLHGYSGHLVVIATLFFLVATVLQFWPAEPLAYREGERAPTDLRAPVSFRMVNEELTEQQREARKAMSPPVLVRTPARDRILAHLSSLGTDIHGITALSQVPTELATRFPGLNDKAILAVQQTDPESYKSQVRVFLNHFDRIVLVSPEDRALFNDRHASQVAVAVPTAEGNRIEPFPIDRVFVVTPAGLPTEVRPEFEWAARNSFSLQLVEPIVNYLMSIKEPMHRYDAKLTAQVAQEAANQIPPDAPLIQKDHLIVARGELITPQKYHMLKEAHEAFLQSVPRRNLWFSYIGRVLIVAIITIAGALYVTRLTKIAKSIRQAWAVCGLLLLTLTIAKTIVAFAPQSLFCLGIAPTLLATIILVIAYNQRFALGVSALHGLLVTLTLGQGMEFFLPLLAGVAAFSFGLHEIRTRSKLIEIGVIASAAIFGSVWATGFAQMAGGWGAGGGGGASQWIAPSDVQWLAMQSLWAAAAGVSVAMFALAVLPTIERLFNITTAMTLLELCDASKPLLRRLSQEAAGTFNHSLTVGIMAESAGNAIGANGLLCRVGAYYHDVGKLSKPQYFIENQAAGHPNRHDKLSPAMSLLIIVGHVKDGIELAREYNLPWIIHQFIGQHHGTTLVEYFFHAARKRAEQDEDSVEISDTEFRYPGPKPQSRETAIVMICDGCESAVRAIDEPTAGRIESTVHNMIMKRLMDGQFAECDLTLRDLGIIEETLVRTLAAIHHGRVAYPTTATTPAPMPSISQPA